MSYMMPPGQKVKKDLRRTIGEGTRGCLMAPPDLMKKKKKKKNTHTHTHKKGRASGGLVGLE